MRRLVCRLRGHSLIRVASVGTVARPGGMLPCIDGMVAYRPDPSGDHLACTRCRQVDPEGVIA